MSTIKHLLFDNDGTIVDSEIIAVRSMLKLLQSCGLDMTEQSYCQQFPGLTLRDILQILREKYGLDLPDKVLEETRAEHIRLFERDLQAVPGMHQLFQNLKTPKSMVSNGSINHVERSLNLVQLRHALDGHIFSAEQVDRPKPFPDVYQHALQVLNLSATEVLVIEDSPVGVQSAKAANLYVIGFLGATHVIPGHGDLLKKNGADFVAENAAQLNNQLQKFRIQ